MNHGLKDSHIRDLVAVLREHAGVEKAVLFGSRAMGTFTLQSDVDICLFGDLLSLTDHAELAAAIEELPIPQKVDLVLEKNIKDKALLEHIRREGKVLFGREGRAERLAVDWKTARVSAVCESIVDCVNKTAPIIEADTPFRMIRTTNVKAGRLNLAGARHVTEDVFRVWTRRAVPTRGDVILTREAPLGEVAIVRDERNIFLGQRLVQYRADKTQLDPLFLYYAFLSPVVQTQIHAFGGTGSTVDHICVPDCEKFTIPLPPLPTQRAIAHILGTLDDKIELNRQMNETLEAMARTLFKSWFVDFDPVRAKAEGRQPSGMDAETAKLFPSEFVDSELGEIPKGWTVGPLSEVCTVKHGYAFKGEYFSDDPTEWSLLTPRNFRIGGGFQETSPKYYRGPTVSEFELKGGELVVSMTDLSKAGDTLGYGALVPRTGKTRFLHNQRVGLVEPLGPSGMSRELLYQVLVSPAYRATVLGSASGSTVRHTSPSRILAHKTVMPPEPIWQRLAPPLKSLHERVDSVLGQQQSLAALRDSLLPRLLSGELSVARAEREVGVEA